MHNKWTLATLISLFGTSAFSAQRQPDILEWPLNTPKRKRSNPVDSFNPQQKFEANVKNFLEKVEEEYKAYRAWLPASSEEALTRAFLAGCNKEKKDRIKGSPASRQLFEPLS